MMLIPMIHVLGQGGVIGAATPFSATYETSWLLMAFLLVAVNCFVLITGYVSYGKEKKFYRLFTLWLEVIFYSVVITTIFKFIYPDEIGLEHFWKGIIPTLYTKGQFSRYWFFTAYAGMFLLSPFVNLGLKHFSYLLGGRFAFLAEQNPLVMVGGVILAGIGIFVVCALIDWIRELLFRKLLFRKPLFRKLRI